MASSQVVYTRAEAPNGIPNKPYLTLLCLALTDSLGLLVAVVLAVLVKRIAIGPVAVERYLELWPFLFVFLFVYAAIGLYSIVALSPPEELRRGTISSAVVFLVLAAATVSIRDSRQWFTWTLFLASALSSVLFPLMRACIRQWLAKESWWGFPAVVFGAGPAGKKLVRAMLNDPAIGLKPIAFIDTGLAGDDKAPSPGPLGPHPSILYAVFAAEDIPAPRLQELMKLYRPAFSRLLVIPDTASFTANCICTSSKSIAGMLALEISHPGAGTFLKRVVDLVVATLSLPAALPLSVFISLCIKLDSPGPVFYRQKRIGQGGRMFRAWKFRSMVVHADQVLQAHLQSNAEARREWENTHKLKNDPRVTRAGRFLRRTSLDELPQLLNVLTGEMSMVGPRPIVESEIRFYGDYFELYKRVHGGITGLWQVSGRSDTSYGERVELDVFYVRNWSVWLDLCILFRTISVVLFRKGAY